MSDSRRNRSIQDFAAGAGHLLADAAILQKVGFLSLDQPIEQYVGLVYHHYDDILFAVDAAAATFEASLSVAGEDVAAVFEWQQCPRVSVA